jgi:large subunit ribosomal protein L35
MPKQKTRRSACKRFRVTGKGKIKYKHSFKNHILTHKKPKTIRGLRKTGILDKTSERSVRRMLTLKVGRN